MFFDNLEQALCFRQHCILTGEEFVQLLLACAPSREDGQPDKRVIAAHQAILWILYDTGIRLSELINLRVEDFDREHGLITVKGQRSKQRLIALGQNCLRTLIEYLDDHRRSGTEFAEKSNLGEDSMFLSEMGRQLTKPDITFLFETLKKRANLPEKCLYPSTFRDTFALRYLELSHDAISLQKLLGEEDVVRIKGYMQIIEASMESMVSEESFNSVIPLLSVPGITRRRAFHSKEQKKETK